MLQAKTSRTHSRTYPRRDLVADVTQDIRQSILTQVFRVEKPLPSEMELADQFQVSRTVIREAMRNLRSQGLVEISQGCRPRVKPPDAQVVTDSLSVLLQRCDDSLKHLIEVRRPLEGQIAELAASRAKPKDIQDMRDAMTALSKANTLAKQIEADVRFHRLLAQAADNPIFVLLLETITELLCESRRRTIKRTGIDRALAGHRDILIAVEKGNGPQARAAMLKHLQMTACDLGG